MARFISRPIPEHDPQSEVRTATALERLSDEWTVLHSVAWQGPRGNRVGDGEADFVLVHARYGLLVLEVKGGGISVDRGAWYSIDRFGKTHPIKDPYRQATASKVGLHRWCKERLGADIPTGHSVVLPDIAKPPVFGPHAPTEITIGSHDLFQIAECIESVVEHWQMAVKGSPVPVDKVVQALAPTVFARRTLSVDAYEAEAKLFELTERQKQAFAGMRRVHRALITGGAGTGKTILALEKARQLNDEGNKVLLTCYNELLGKNLSHDLSLKGIETGTFHSICLSYMRKAELVLPSPIPPSWWQDEAPLRFVEAIEKTNERFDAVIIDEGQDFASEWVEALMMITNSYADAPFYVFADENQTLWPRSWKADRSWPIFDLPVNCRNTLEISQIVQRLGGPSSPVGTVSGPGPKWSDIGNSTSPRAMVPKIVANLLLEDFSASDIVVLCEDAGLVRQLRGMSAGSEPFCAFGERGVCVETIGRFKGLESTAVVVVLSAEAKEPDRLAYVGFSRAKTYLRVIAPPRRKAVAKWNA